MAKQVKVKILEMEQGYFDVYNMIDSITPKFMLSVERDELYSFISGLRIMNNIPGNDFDITFVSFKSYDLMFESHMALGLEECDSIYGGVFEDHPTDCFVCDIIDSTVSNYYESVGVKQYV